VSRLSLCIIGNSHTAAYVGAWKKKGVEQKTPNLAPTFFASNSNELENLVFADGVFFTADAKLAAQLELTSGGKQRIVVDDYDAFLLIGLGVRITVRTLLEGFGTVEQRSWAKSETLVSRACFEAMVAATLRETPAFRFLEQIRSCSSKPVLICPTPYRSDVEAEWSFLRKSHRRFADAEYRRKLLAQVTEIGSAFARARGAEMLWQDESTVDSPGFTKAEFARGAVRLAEGQSEDGMHMNEDYGRIMLERAIARLDAMCGGKILGDDAQRERLRA
jgi:hypothetical protein